MLATFPAGSAVTYVVTAIVAQNPPAVVVNTASATSPSGGTCSRGGTAPPCNAPVSVPVVGHPAAPVPIDGRWMLVLLGALLTLAGAGFRLRIGRPLR